MLTESSSLEPRPRGAFVVTTEADPSRANPLSRTSIPKVLKLASLSETVTELAEPWRIAFEQLSNTQVQVLRLISEGKTNAQIAEIRGRSLAATESAVTRTLKALGLDDASEQNVRVAAARKFLTNQPNA